MAWVGFHSLSPTPTVSSNIQDSGSSNFAEDETKLKTSASQGDVTNLDDGHTDPVEKKSEPIKKSRSQGNKKKGRISSFLCGLTQPIKE